MIKPTNQNYYTPEMNAAYFSVSQFKAFEKCEAAALAELRGEYVRESTPALLIGSYVDAYFSGEMYEFIDTHPEIFNKRSGELKSEFRQADSIIKRMESDELMNEYLQGDKQRIFTGELFGHQWKIKTDIYNGDRIVDMKVVKDMGDVYERGAGFRSFIEFWGYDLQAAIYTRIEQIESGRAERLPFYLAVATKEKEPDIELIEIPDFEQDAALRAHGVEAKINRYSMIKSGLVPPIRCEGCEYCRRSKKLVKPKIFTIERGLDE